MSIDLLQKWQQQKVWVRLLIVVCPIIIGASIWLFVLNQHLRKENWKEKKLRKESILREMRAYASFDSLMLSVAERDKQDSIRAIADSQFVAKISELNKTITTLSENRSTISTLPVNEFVDLVTGYIDSAK